MNTPSGQFTSNKPYLFRAIFEWLLDNNATPYILVDAQKAGVEVPSEHIKDGQIVLNVTPSAVQEWLVDNKAISFRARFSGVARQIYVPMNSLMAVYAQENGLGMAFPAIEEDDAEFADESPTSQKNIPSEPKSKADGKKNSQAGKPNHLTVIK